MVVARRGFGCAGDCSAGLVAVALALGMMAAVLMVVVVVAVATTIVGVILRGLAVVSSTVPMMRNTRMMRRMR